MATQNLTGIDALLENVYKGPIVEQMNQETQMLSIIRKTSANDMGTFRGRQLIFPVHTSRNRGRGSVTDGGQLPTAGTQGTGDGLLLMKYFSGAIEISDQAVLQSQSAPVGSFVKGLEFEADNCKQDLQKDVQRIVFGTGDGLLAACTTTQATVNTFAVDSGQYIAVGDPVDVIIRSSGATGTGAVGRTVTAVSFSGATANSATQTNANITVSGATISVDNTYGVYVSGDRSQESDGLRNIASTGRTLHGINSSTNAYWDSNLKDFGQANPSEDGIMQLVQQIRQRSGTTPDYAVFSLGGQRRLANTYGSIKRFTDNHATNIDGGYDSIMVSAGGKPLAITADVDCPAGTGFLLNRSALCWSELSEPHWLAPPDGSGMQWYLKDGSSLGTKSRVWQGFLIWDAVLACTAPNRQGKFININDDVPVVRL